MTIEEVEALVKSLSEAVTAQHVELAKAQSQNDAYAQQLDALAGRVEAAESAAAEAVSKASVSTDTAQIAMAHIASTVSTLADLVEAADLPNKCNARLMELERRCGV